MARIKQMVKGQRSKGLKSKRYEDRGKRRGEQGKGKPGAPNNGYSGGARRKSMPDAKVKGAYAKRKSKA